MLRYLDFCSGFFARVGKRLDKRTKINLKNCRSNRQEVSCKKSVLNLDPRLFLKLLWGRGWGVLRNFAKFTGRHLCQSLFFKYQVFLSMYNLLLGLQLDLKRDSGTGVSLWILQNFSEDLFLQITSDGCFWN